MHIPQTDVKNEIVTILRPDIKERIDAINQIIKPHGIQIKYDDVQDIQSLLEEKQIRYTVVFVRFLENNKKKFLKIHETGLWRIVEKGTKTPKKTDWDINLHVLEQYKKNPKRWHELAQQEGWCILYAYETTDCPTTDVDKIVALENELVRNAVVGLPMYLSSGKRLPKNLSCSKMSPLFPEKDNIKMLGEAFEIQATGNWSFVRTDEQVVNCKASDQEAFNKLSELVEKTQSKPANPNTPRSPSSTRPVPSVSKEDAEKVLEILETDWTFNERDKWLGVAIALKHTFDEDTAFDLFRDFSMTVNGTENKFKFNSWMPGGDDYQMFYALQPNGDKTFASLMFHAKEINEEAYYAIFPAQVVEEMTTLERQMMDCFSHGTVADLYAASSYASTHKYDELEKKWYSVLPNNVWYDHPDAITILQEIREVGQKCLQSLASQLSNKSVKDKKAEKKRNSDLKLIHAKLLQIGNHSFLNSVATLLKGYFKDNGFGMKLNTNLELFACEDEVYDLTTKEWRKIVPQDMISHTTKYKRPSPNPQVLKEVLDFWDDLFHTPEESLYHQLTKASAMFEGNKEQTFYVLTGAGENGKGVDEQLTSILYGDYYIDVSPSAITKPQMSANEHSDWPRTIGKRYLHFGEPNQDAVLQNDIIKKITGQDTMTARGIYGKVVSWLNAGVMFLVCNSIPRPSLDEKAFRRRLRVLNFPFQYQDQDQIEMADEEERELLKLKNYELKIKFMNNPEYAQQAMLHLLDLYINHIHNKTKITVPERFEKAQANYLVEGNPVLAFVLENFDVDPTFKHPIKAEVLRSMYNQSKYGRNRQLTHAQFPTYIKEHVPNKRSKDGVFYYLKQGGLNKSILEMSADEEETQTRLIKVKKPVEAEEVEMENEQGEAEEVEMENEQGEAEEVEMENEQGAHPLNCL
jgi:phage/plasmid-associated DNA primase